MPKPRRFLFPKTFVLVTTRTEVGLPFSPSLNYSLLSILARAQHLYNVKIAAFIWMGNHLHILLEVENPEDIPAFMRRIKTESAHLVNKLKGIKRKTVWAAGYDAVPILTLEDAIEKFCYLYTNPQSAHLVERIEQYPGASSWQMFSSDSTSKSYRWKPRGNYTNAYEEEFPLKVDHLGWLHSVFGVTTKEISSYKERIVSRIKEIEGRLLQERKAEGKKVLGAYGIKNTPPEIRESFQPKKFGRRMWCICRDKDFRKLFISSLKHIIDKARDVYNRWKSGDFSIPYPPELFPPRIPKLANVWGTPPVAGLV